VGADLEDDGENDLSYVTSVLTRDLKAQRGEQKRQALLDRLTRFNGELASNGLELPRFYYYPEIPVASSTVVTEEVHVSDQLGKVSGDIAELCSGPWSDRIQIVMQTGGATHWSNNLINPNRTQRFLYKNGEFSEVADLPLQPAAETETLAGIEFLDHLSWLNCSGSSNGLLALGRLVELDVSHNPLTFLDCTANPCLSVIWLKTGQEIESINYDSSVSSIYYK
jgi:hypothetical protein